MWMTSFRPDDDVARSATDWTSSFTRPPLVLMTATRLGVSKVALSRVLHKHARISPNLAVRLEEAGVGTGRAWLAMQSAYDLAIERAADTPKVRKRAGTTRTTLRRLERGDPSVGLTVFLNVAGAPGQ